MIRISFAFFFFLLTQLILAQDFEVSPVLMGFNANPGEIQTKTINLINHSSKPQKYTFKLSDYDVDIEGVKKSLPLGSSKRSVGDWVTINPSFVEMNPNQALTIDVLMTVPKDGFNTRWGMIYVEVAREQSSFEADQNLATGVIVVPRIVVLVKQSPLSNNNYRATIDGLKEVTKAGDAFRSFEVMISNTGENLIDANVSLALANIADAREEKFNPTQVTVYPGMARRVVLQMPSIISKGQYALAAILDYGHRQPLEGTQILLEVK